MEHCNICGRTTFGRGPGGRLSVTGKLPYCLACGSLERHRAIRAAFLKVLDGMFNNLRAIQFSNNPSVDPKWFRSLEVSQYGGDNSLDLMRIDRDSAAYDVVICNHVLEHVRYDNAALTELIRITAPLGFLFLTFPDPARREITVDFEAPDPDHHDHWRVYGRDVVHRFRRYLPDVWALAHETADPATGADDMIYLLTRDAVTADRLRRQLCPVDLVCSPSDR